MGFNTGGDPVTAIVFQWDSSVQKKPDRYIEEE